ncbi:MAG: PQQ-binding-like beta-propeller repeat protein [Methanoregula sp.]|jgi:WD40 repeat protein
MKTDFWFRLLLISSIIAGCLVGAAGAVSLGTDWKERAPEEGPYLGVTITPDASLIYAGGSVIYVRSWDKEIHWGNTPARLAALSYDGKRVVIGVGNKLSVLDNKGVENWSRNMDGYVKAIAISPNGSFIISADDKGNYVSWSRDGDMIARLENQTANTIAYAPTGNFVVVATDKGLRFYNRKLELIWYDTRTESRDEFIAISGDGSTVITAGYNQVASYSSDGTLNWRKEITKDPIIDMDCSFDCSAIIVGGQDKEVVAIDRSGTVRWTYNTGQWVNAVSASRDASVIAAGGIGRTLYVFDRSGTLLISKKTDAIIQPRSIAVSSDGRKIVVADQMNLYGFSMIGDAVAPDVPVTYTQAPLNPVPTTNPTPVPTATMTTTATSPVLPTKTVPVKPTTYSPVNPLILLPALGGAFLLIRSRH